ncbi:hypothetical protein GCM10022220_71920 [Actinocatenispora rupis]|uniref:Activator of Hsp90 ATPase homologue 1/2-like C-terminal domain-containing protein n=1 Tax=Actinocatenispora rupis TaxID=519421 RepID=A0A8J3JI30_9ACTN|nr:hypothetical protein Aru02nite_71770 [Actinocatenispora rupis]
MGDSRLVVTELADRLRIRVELPGVAAGHAMLAWTDPAELRTWWGGGELTAELRPGGAYVVAFPRLGQIMRGEVVAYRPDRSLAFTWS